MQRHGNLPFCHLNLKSPKPDGRYPSQLQRLGDYIRKRRLDLDLLQKEVASRLGAGPTTINNWAMSEVEPQLRFVPGILTLGYHPRPAGKTFSQRLRLERTARGLSIRSLSNRLGIDSSTAWKWEEARRHPIPQRRLRSMALQSSPKLLNRPANRGEICRILEGACCMSRLGDTVRSGRGYLAGPASPMKAFRHYLQNVRCSGWHYSFS